MGIEALYRKPNLSHCHAAQPISPYLLRHAKVERPNLVWATDIPLRRGFDYLIAVIDWYCGIFLYLRLANKLTTDFSLHTVREAIARYGWQPGQFTRVNQHC